MIGSFIGLLIAAIYLFNPELLGKYADLKQFPNFFIIVSLLFLVLQIISSLILSIPLQRSTKSITPHLINLFKKDESIKLIPVWFFIFVIITFMLSNNPIISHEFTFAILVLCFGISFDLLRHYIKKSIDYINPFNVIQIFKDQGTKDIQNEREVDLLDRFDALNEIAIKAIDETNPSLANSALNENLKLSKIFLESSKSISHHKTDPQIEALGIKDKINYVLSYLFQKIDFVFQKALDEKLEPVLGYLVTFMGKITIYAAKYDLTLSLQPLIYLGKFATKSIENKFQDVGVRASCTLLEVAKSINTEIDLTYLEIQDTYLCLIRQLENIAKETFKQDKNMKIQLLIQPFLDVKELFSSEKMAAHQDTQVILKDIERVIAEFQVLESVMRTIPPLNTNLNN